MECYRKDATIVCTGTLSEDTDFTKIRECLEEIVAQGSSSMRVIVDMSAVKRANSCGLLSWINLIKSFKVQFVYEKAPIWLVDQFNTNDEFLSDNTTVTSVLAPFFSTTTGKHHILTLSIGKDVPLQSSYNGFVPAIVGMEGEVLEPDFDSDEYFYFLVPKTG